MSIREFWEVVFNVFFLKWDYKFLRVESLVVLLIVVFLVGKIGLVCIMR